MLFFFQAEAGIRDIGVTGVQTCALPIFSVRRREAEAAEALVAEEAERFRTWQASLAVVPAIASLRAWAEEIRRPELAKAEARSEERRVGKEGRSRWSPEHSKKTIRRSVL